MLMLKDSGQHVLLMRLQRSFDWFVARSISSVYLVYSCALHIFTFRA